MENKFTKEDIKVGYMVEIESEGHRGLFITTIYKEKGVFTDGNTWYKWSEFDEDLCSKHAKITKVYSWPDCIVELWYNNTNNRPVLWERPLAKKMTKKEIEEILGYEIEII